MSDVIQPPLPIKTEDELKKQQIDEFVDDDNFKAFFTIVQDIALIRNKGKYILYLLYYYLSSVDKEHIKYAEIKLKPKQFMKILEHIELTNNNEYGPLKIPELLDCFNSRQLLYLNDCIFFDEIMTYPTSDYTLDLSLILTIEAIFDYNDKYFKTEKSNDKGEYINMFFIETKIFKIDNKDVRDKLMIDYIYNSIHFLNHKGLIKEYLIYYFIHILSSSKSSIIKFKWFLYYLDYSSLKLIIPK